jgi:VanZ family protein
LKIISSFIRYHFPAILWAAIILFLMSLPAQYIPKVKIIGYDKIAHAGVFFLFGILIYRSIINWKHKPASIFISLMLMLFFVMVFGCLSELYQHFIPSRTPDVYDFFADSIGGLFSIIAELFYNFYKTKERLKVSSN